MEWISRILGLATAFYVFRGMLGKAREGDMKIFLGLLGAWLALFALQAL